MRQTLFFVPHELAGLPVFGFGWIFAIWALASLGYLGWLIAKQGFSPEVRGLVPVLLVVGAVLLWVLPAVEEPGEGLPIRGYGVMMLLAVGSGMWLALERARRMGLDPDLIVSLAFWMFVSGIVGARLFYVVEYWSQMRSRLEAPSLLSLLGMLVNYTRGGLVVYGALAGAALAFLAFCWRRKLPTLAIADLIAPSLALGQGLGRLGCFLSGCCFGGACDLPWAVTFPWGTAPHVHQIRTGQTDLHGLWLDYSKQEPVVAKVEPDSAAARAGIVASDRIEEIDGQRVASSEQALAMLVSAPPGEELVVTVAGKPPLMWATSVPLPRSRPVHPAQLYSAFDALLLCGLLLAYYPFRRRDGEVIALGLTLHAITRYLLEVIRIDEPSVFGTGLSISQTISVGMLVALAAGWAWLLTRPRGSALPAAV